MEVILEEITKTNCNFLDEMLYEAIYIPESSTPLPKSIINEPELFKYIEDWGREADIGFIAKYNDKMIGAVWVRLFLKNQKSFGFIDEKIPELSIAVKKQYRNMGVGSKLLLVIFNKVKSQGYYAISLSVDKRNRAVKLYKKLGFKKYNTTSTSYTMKKIL